MKGYVPGSFSMPAHWRSMRALAAARSGGQSDFDGLHFYTFGGYIRTCRWIERIASGRFTLDERGGFEVARS